MHATLRFAIYLLFRNKNPLPAAKFRVLYRFWIPVPRKDSLLLYNTTFFTFHFASLCDVDEFYTLATQELRAF